jgi:Na+-driven multidrug efflux pump
MCTQVALWIMTILAIPMVFLPRPLLRLLVDSKQVVDLGVWPLIWAGLAQPAFAVAIVKSMALKGAGDTVSPMWTTITGMGGRVVLILLAMAVCVKYGHADWGLVIVWIGIFLDLGYRGVVMEIVFRRGKWQAKKV